jgi:predicted nuclease of predicted toxin-antitoxin system
LHVRELGMLGDDDDLVWARAASDGLTIVTKDDDFRQFSFLRGAPPKVIWLVVATPARSASPICCCSDVRVLPPSSRTLRKRCSC